MKLIKGTSHPVVKLLYAVASSTDLFLGVGVKDFYLCVEVASPAARRAYSSNYVG